MNGYVLHYTAPDMTATQVWKISYRPDSPAGLEVLAGLPGLGLKANRIPCRRKDAQRQMDMLARDKIKQGYLQIWPHPADASPSSEQGSYSGFVWSGRMGDASALGDWFF